MIKLRTFVLLLACVAATPVGAQKTAAEVTDAQVAEYKAAAQKVCEEGGQKTGDPQDKVGAFCGCLMAVLSKSMTQSEWQQAYLFSRKNQPEEERKLLAPHMKQVATCRPEAPAPAASNPASDASTPAPAAAPGLGGGAGLSQGRGGPRLSPPPAKGSPGLR